MVLLRYVFSSCKETIEPIRGPLLLVYPQQTTRYLNTHPAAINNVYIVHTFDSKGSGLSIYLQHRPIETIYKYIHICTYTYIYPYGHIFIMRERRDNVKSIHLFIHLNYVSILYRNNYIYIHIFFLFLTHISICVSTFFQLRLFLRVSPTDKIDFFEVEIIERNSLTKVQGSQSKIVSPRYRVVKAR